jgi:predicted metal-binding membrane protein
MASERASQQAFFGVSALLFAASAAVTIVWCGSMSAMGEMPMPGGWTMSMAWMRMPGQTWPGVAASFLGMWVVMMVAMMLPSLVPMLWRYRQAVGRTGETRLGRLIALVGVGYVFVWTHHLPDHAVARRKEVELAGAVLRETHVDAPRLRLRGWSIGAWARYCTRPT